MGGGTQSGSSDFGGMLRRAKAAEKFPALRLPKRSSKKRAVLDLGKAPKKTSRKRAVLDLVKTPKKSSKKRAVVDTVVGPAPTTGAKRSSKKRVILTTPGPATPEELAAKIFKEATDVKAFGGGMASNVVRFFLQELAKGGRTDLVQSRPAEKDETKRLLDEVYSGVRVTDYAFYARMNTCSAAAFAAIRDFCQRVVSHVSTTKGWAKDSKGARVIVPRILLNVDASQQELFTQLSQWIEGRHKNAGKQFNTDSTFHSITVVEGTRAEAISDLLLFEGRCPTGLQTHMKELALLHALDVAIGMGDRLQNPNLGNVTLNPQTLQTVLIDVDTFLPPKGIPELIEAACKWTTEDCMFFNRVAQEYMPYDNQSTNQQKDSWPPCPPRLPLQGNYMKGVMAALKHDLKLYADRLQVWLDEDIPKGTYHGKKVHPTTGFVVQKYHTFLTTWQQVFVETAAHVLKAIRDGVNTGTFALSVEDKTCSGERIKERVNQWMF